MYIYSRLYNHIDVEHVMAERQPGFVSKRSAAKKKSAFFQILFLK